MGETKVSQFALDENGVPLQGDGLLDFVRELGGDTVFLQFSTGKDSICSWMRLREYGKFKIIPYFMYWFPGLSWQEEALDYYENWFGQRIMRLPHPLFHQHLNEFLYQPPHRVGEIFSWDLLKWDFSDLENALAAQFGLDDPLPYAAMGFRGADNIDRRNLIIQKGAVGSGRRRYFFPVWEYNVEDVSRVIKQSGIKLPADYKKWGRTIGAWDYQYIKPISEHFPEDFDRVIRFWMPLIDAEIIRHDIVGAYANAKIEAMGESN